MHSKISIALRSASVLALVAVALLQAPRALAQASPDIDGDGISDAADNCVLVANAAQTDSNSDGYGNRCDPDLNNDGIVNSVDLGLFRSVFFTSNADADFNGDGVVNPIDLGVMRSLYFQPPGPSGPLPIIAVTPTAIGFGEVLLGDDATVAISVENDGYVPLTVSSITVSGAPFSVFPPTSFTILPGEPPRLVQLGFEPELDAFYNGTVTLESNADIDPTVVVGLNGVGRDPNPAELPDISVSGSLEFGAVPESSFAIRTLTVVNLGTAPLTISGLASSDNAFTASPLTGELPRTVSPNASAQIVVRFEPPAASAGSTYSGTLSIASNDPDNPAVTLAFSGQSVVPPVPVNVPVVSARIRFNPFDQITAATCSNVGGEIQFGAASLATDLYRVELTDQQGTTVASAPLAAPAGAALATYNGIDACGLADGVIDVRVIVTRDAVDMPAYPGTPAAKNTGSLLPPMLDAVEPATVFSVVEVCGTSRSDTTVSISGGSSVVLATLDSGTTSFCLDVPLRPNRQNTLIAMAIDNLAVAPRPVATAPPVQIVQVNPSDIVIAEVNSEPLDEDAIADLVENGVIDLDDPSNYNVSIFTIVFTVGSFPVTVSAPIAVPTDGSSPVVGGGSWGPSGSGGDGTPPSPPSGCRTGCTGIVGISTPDGGVIPGVIIIDGRILTLREFFQVTLAILNASPTFTLSDVESRLALPSGLTPVAAGLGLDVSDVNTGGQTDSVVIGTIAPGDTGAGQFIVRGDSIGTYNVAVDYDGFITGGPLPTPVAFDGSAGTSVQVFGPPDLGVVVRHPSDPFGPDVALNETYDLIVEITNLSTRPALYTSLDLFVGGSALLLDENGSALPESHDVRDFGTIPPGGTVAATFIVQSLAEGELIACQAVASDNISLTIDTGPDGTDCNIANTIPADFQPLPADAPPALFAINPLNGQGNIPVTSSVLATLTPESGCLTADTWTNVVTQPIGGDPANGFEIVSADFVSAGSFYLEELDAYGDPVAHIPTDLTVVSPPAGGTTIATLRLGLPSPLSQTFLKSNTGYRATLVGADTNATSAVCNVSNATPMASTYQWTFSTEQNCGGLSAPTATLRTPPDGSIDVPLNQQIVLDFSNRMNPASLAFNPADLTASTIGYYSGAMVVGDDLSGETPLPGAASFSNLNRTFTFTPVGNLPTGETIHVRLTDGLRDECGNPLQTPPSGVSLFSFDTTPPDGLAPAQPVVNAVPVLTNRSPLLVSGNAEPSSTVDVAGGAISVSSSVPGSGLFTVNTPLIPDQSNALQVTATDASGNTSAPPVLNDLNGDPLVVFYDATAPAVLAVAPADGATDVLRTSSVDVQFSEPIGAGTVNNLNFTLRSGAPVSGTFALIGSDGFTFTPDTPLAYATTYTVQMRASGIRDIAGNGLAADSLTSFVTEVPPPPILDSLTPDIGQRNQTLNVTFAGSILGTAEAVISTNSGVSGTVLSATDTTVMAEISIAIDAPLGATTLGLTTAGGSASLPFTVDPAPPVVTSIAQASGPRGGTVTTQLVGSGLADLTSITIDGTGVTLSDLGTGDDTTRDIEIVIAPDAALGPRTVTATNAAGSDTAVFTVGSGDGHYWRFESTPGFLNDSVGGATLTPIGAPTQVTLPAGGRGVEFPGIVDVTDGGANVAASEDGGFTANITSGLAGNFSIEAFVHFDSLTASFGKVIAGTANASDDFGWYLMVRTDGLGGTAPRELALFFDAGAGINTVASGVVLETGVDYYVGATFDVDGSEAVFYVQDLTAGTPLQANPVAHTVSSIIPVPSLYIAEAPSSSSFRVDGLIDEIRLSDRVLGQSELLISNAFDPVITLTPPATTTLTRSDITLTAAIDAAAGPGGLLIALSSNDASVTVPATVTIPEGATSADFTATTGNVATSATITAGAGGFESDTASVNVQLRDVNLTVPLVGLGQTVQGTVTLAEVAPTGGATILLASDDETIATVSPASVFIAAGASTASFDVTGGNTIGSATITADGATDGYGSDARSVSVTNRQIDLPSSDELALDEILTVQVLIGPDPAPAGGVDINLSSSNSGIVDVLTPVVTIPAGQLTANATVQALAPGQITLTATNAGFLSDAMIINVTTSVDFLQTDVTIDDVETTNLYLQLESGSALYDAPAPIDLTLSSSDTDCASVSATATVPTGEFFATTPVSYGGSTTLPCTATVTASNPIFGTSEAMVTVDTTPPGLGAVSILTRDNGNDVRLGNGLQARYYVNLASGNHGGVTLIIESSDPSRLRLATDANSPGAPLIAVDIPDGSTSTFSTPFYAQGVSGASGTVTMTASEPQFSDGTLDIEVVPVVLDLAGLVTTTTSLSANNAFYVQTWTLNEAGTAFQRRQGVSAGAGPLSVTLTSSTPAVGDLVTSAFPDGAASVTVEVPVASGSSSTGGAASGGVEFDPATGGSTDINASAPGFAAFPDSDTQNVDVSQPALGLTTRDNFNDVRLGNGLQARYYLTLGGSDHGGVTVRVTSSDPTKVTLSLDSTTPGTGFIDVFIPDGSTSTFGTPFYAQGVSGASGTVTMTASEPQFSDGTLDIEVVPVVLDLAGLVTTTTSLSANNAFYVQTWTLNEAGTAFQRRQGVSAGAGPLSVTLTSSTPAVGDLVTSAFPDGAASVTVEVPVASGSSSTGGAASGGVEFDPATGGSTDINASAPGFAAFPDSDTQNVDVSQPALGLTTRDNFNDVRLGNGLQARYYLTLGGSDHGGVTVRVTSSDPTKVTLSLDSTTPGTGFIDVFIPDGSTSTFGTPFYAQGVSGASGTVTMTASEPQFSDGTLDIEVVPVVLDLAGLVTTTTSLSANNAFYVQTWTLNEAGTAFQRRQGVSAGAGPLSVTLTSSTPAVGDLVTSAFPDGAASVTVEVPVASGSSSTGGAASGGVEFDPATGGSTDINASAPGFAAFPDSDTQNVDVSQPALGLTTRDNFNDVRLGNGLQARYYLTLGGSDHGGVTVRVTSSDPTKVTLSLDSTTPGTGFIDVFIPDGSTSTFGTPFYAQGVSGASGTVTMTASEPQFSDGTIDIEVVPVVLDLTGLVTTTTSLSPNDAFYVRTATLNPAGTALQRVQGVSAGAGPLSVMLTSSTPAVGDLVTTAFPDGAASITVEVPVASSSSSTGGAASGGVEFDPATGGSTNISASASGFASFSDSDTQTVDVSQPALGLVARDSGNDVRLGNGLQARYYLTLGGSDHGGVTVRVTSSDPTKVTLSLDSTTPGTGFIDIFIPDGSTSNFSTPFYAQGVSGASGTVTMTASEPQFSDGTIDIEVVPVVLDLTGLVTTTTSLSPNDAFYVRTATLNPAGTALQRVQGVSAGAGPLSVMLTSSTPAVGDLVTTAFPDGAASVTVEVPVASSSSSTGGAASGGVEFDPATGGSTDINASAPGFTAFPDSDTQTVTVTE